VGTENMSRGDKKDARSAGMSIAEKSAGGNKGWHGMKQLTLEFADGPTGDTVARVVVDDNHVSISYLELCPSPRHLIYSSAMVDCTVHMCWADRGPAEPLSNERGAIQPALSVRTPVLDFATFRDAKLREARLSFFDKVLMHAESLPW
jgi:hypothetical protein